MINKATFSPYVGLRPFNSDENLLFFGRDEQTLEILQRLHVNRFVAVVGGSGSGKSSLIRAGLIPALKGGYLVEDSSKWIIAVMKPGQNPMYKLAEAILIQIDSKITNTEILDFVKQIKKEGVKSILNLIEPFQKEQNVNFFLLVDQFEELFRFTMGQKDAAKKTEAVDFVNMMLNLSKQSKFPCYVVLTMRSDFIGDCAQFHDLPQAMNKSQYLVPRLNRQQLKMVIEGPAKLYGVKFCPGLTSQLLNDLGKVKDELPLIQHALMRIWNHELTTDKSGELDLEDYRKIGGIENALSNHADEALSGMSNEEMKITKQLFQALTAIDENGRKIRRPVLFSQLNDLTEGSEEQLRHIIDLFIKDKRSFLIIDKTGDSGDEIVDISHESLIRQWDTLSKWVDEEGESASNYLQLVEASKLYKLKRKDFLEGTQLQITLDWNEKFKPTAIWANRYKQGFEECMAYLNASEAEHTRVKNIEKRRKQIKRNLILSIMGLLLITAFVGILLSRSAIKSGTKAKVALEKAEKLVNAFYFFDDKFALAFSNDKDFYFIDKNGNRIEKLKKWKKAEQFDDYGYAKVRDENEIDYMLDTSGNSYKAAYSTWEIILKDSIMAVDLSSQLYDALLPEELFSAKGLKVLYLGDNQLTSLPVKIGELRNLTALNLNYNQLDSLPKEMGELKNLTQLFLRNNKLNSLPHEIGDLKNLTMLGLRNNQFKSLPKEIWKLKNLTELYLGGNQLTSLPNKIGELEYLSKLVLSDNQLKDLPIEIGKLKKLYSLDLSINKLTSLPKEIRELKNLTELYLSNNQLNTLTKEICKLEKLTWLNLDSNQLMILPKETGNLKNLTDLRLSKNKLSVLPKEIGNLEKLTVLLLGRNQLTILPKEIWELKNLTWLDLSFNQLSIEPKQIGKLKKLTWLGLANNQLTSLPKEIGELKDLSTLSLNNNRLSSLPNEIGELKKLTWLGLANNQLTSLPKEIEELKDLSTLRLNNNRLSSLPNKIGELKKLTWLSLANNQLTSLPKEIGELKDLSTLNLSNNRLSSLPNEIGELKNLTWLGLNNNQLSSLPKEIGKLENLNVLLLDSNQLTNLPKEIRELRDLSALYLIDNQLISLSKEIGELKNLIWLGLANNQLDSLPKEIGELISLYSLDLSNNQLTGLPKEIGELGYLYSLDLSGNQLTRLPREIGKLQDLYSLNLTGNNISKTEIEKIRKLLPNCEIITENSSDSEISTFSQ